MNNVTSVTVRVPSKYDFAGTCASVTWGSGRWPNTHWEDGILSVVGWYGGDLVWRTARIVAADSVEVSGTGGLHDLTQWALQALLTPLNVDTSDPVIVALDQANPGVCAFNGASLWDGLIASVVGQGVSLAAAGIAATKLAAIVGDEVFLDGKLMMPLPQPSALAGCSVDDLRLSGLTTARIAAIIGLADAVVAGDLDLDAIAREHTIAPLCAQRGIGPWTAVSALIWGVGDTRHHPTNDAALLRAARIAYARPAMTHRELDALARAWGDHPGSAARLLWTSLLGRPVAAS